MLRLLRIKIGRSLSPSMSEDYFLAERQKLTAYLMQLHCDDPDLLQAFRTIPRELFLSPSLSTLAYRDTPLPIARGQTTTQPSIIAKMLQALELKETGRILEVGTGSGYATALLSQLAAFVYTIEKLDSLAKEAKERFNLLHLTNVTTAVGDGSLGLFEYAPFDAIVVWAGAPKLPKALTNQLAEDGKMVIPLGDRHEQEIILIQKLNGKLTQTKLGEAFFVDLKGQEGW